MTEDGNREIEIFSKEFLAQAAQHIDPDKGGNFYVLQDRSGGSGDLSEYVNRRAELDAGAEREKSSRRERLERQRFWLAGSIILLLGLLIVFAGIGFLRGREVEGFLPVLSIVSPLAAAILTFYFANKD